MQNLILGAITGDVIGSVYEFENVKTVHFDLFTEYTTFTDDSVLTFATMDSLLNGIPYKDAYLKWGRIYPDADYGGIFLRWLKSDNPKPYGSWGNGSAMRVSPIGWAFDTLEETLNQAKLSAEVTHNHPEGIKGAQATAAAVFLARQNTSKKDIKDYIIKTFGYDLNRTIAQILPTYQFDVSCQGSVPEAIIAFLESADYESAIRLAIALGGDSDTIACITGGIAEAFYKEIPEDIVKNVIELLPDSFIKLLEQFSLKYNGEMTNV
jgi:ADP-ribosylglycohydrolase